MKTCETCKWCRIPEDLMTISTISVCDCPFSCRITSQDERKRGNCGPSGRYWEPREEEE